MQALDAIIDWCDQNESVTVDHRVDVLAGRAWTKSTKIETDQNNKKLRVQLSTTSIAQAALKAVVDGNLAGVLNAASQLNAVIKANAVMEEMFFADPPKYAEWTADDWVMSLHRAKRTIINTDMWKETIPQWKRTNAEKYAALVPKKTGRKSKPADLLMK